MVQLPTAVGRVSLQYIVASNNHHFIARDSVCQEFKHGSGRRFFYYKEWMGWAGRPTWAPHKSGGLVEMDG